MTQHGGEPLPAGSLGQAMALVVAVHDHNADDVRDVLTGASRNDLHAIAVALAAMIDPEATPRQLLRWNDGDPIPVDRAPTPVLAPHGTHASFNRHKKAREVPCRVCVEGERIYQRLRQRRRRLQAVAS